MSFWESAEWYAYEVADGDAPGTRSRLLASAPWQTQVIDLTPTERDLWRGVRKSYKSLIHKAERTSQIMAVGPEAMPICRALHDERAGRQTRSAETWNMMARWIVNGHAVLFVSAQSSEVSAYAFFVTFCGWSYYFSAATTAPNLHHALVWHALRYLRGEQIATVLEMGWQGEATDQKGQNIEYFRRGFGGVSVPLSLVHLGGGAPASSTSDVSGLAARGLHHLPEGVE